MPIAAAIDTVFGALANGNKILACGKGASAADAQRFAAYLSARFERERPGLPALALSADASVLAALAEDGGLDSAYAKQVRAHGHAGDLLLVVTATGDSANVLAAIVEAHEREMFVVALTGVLRAGLAARSPTPIFTFACRPSGWRASANCMC